MTGKNHLDHVRNLGGVFFGTHHQDRANLLQDVADQLNGGGAHGARGIDGERDVVYMLAAHCILGDQQPLVFGPGKAGREVILRMRISYFLDELKHGLGRGRRKLAAVRTEQIVNRVG